MRRPTPDRVLLVLTLVFAALAFGLTLWAALALVV